MSRIKSPYVVQAQVIGDTPHVVWRDYLTRHGRSAVWTGNVYDAETLAEGRKLFFATIDELRGDHKRRTTGLRVSLLGTCGYRQGSHRRSAHVTVHQWSVEPNPIHDGTGPEWYYDTLSQTVNRWTVPGDVTVFVYRSIPGRLPTERALLFRAPITGRQPEIEPGVFYEKVHAVGLYDQDDVVWCMCGERRKVDYSDLRTNLFSIMQHAVNCEHALAESH